MENCGDTQPSVREYFRVTNEEFAEFLNDAEANPGSLRSSNMVFDAVGNVTFNASAVDASNRIFSITGSHLDYDAKSAPGSRYRVHNGSANMLGYASQAVVNVTWAGAMKYCNWMSLLDEIPPADRAYREGTRISDWAPATVSRQNWGQGEFTERERDAWARLKGYRLPFVSDSARSLQPAGSAGEPSKAPPTNSWPNAFNEFGKAAGWTTTSNVA